MKLNFRLNCRRRKPKNEKLSRREKFRRRICDIEPFNVQLKRKSFSGFPKDEDKTIKKEWVEMVERDNVGETLNVF